MRGWVFWSAVLLSSASGAAGSIAYDRYARSRVPEVDYCIGVVAARFHSSQEVRDALFKAIFVDADPLDGIPLLKDNQ